MNVSLTNELENFIDGLVNDGMYYSASEVVRDGLRLLKTKEDLKAQKLAELRADIMVGYQQVKRGESRPLDTAAIKSESRRRLAQLKPMK
ncbi:MAG: type II toxin-antitoxin system ParD family antitoxin [Pyrinomonadaceae bacterium]